jgi:ubiquinone/menaquinone biosynthesis C-methylase UbiE
METTTNFEKHNNKNPMAQAVYANFYKELLIFLKSVKHTTILDAGCGEGFSLNRLKEAGIKAPMEGIDFDATAIKIGKKLFPDFKLKQGSVYKLPYKDNSFDIVLCNEVLEHLEEPEKALAELKRVTKSHLLLSVPNEPIHRLQRMARGKAILKLGKHPEHINHWTFFSFRTFLRRNGLTLKKVSYPFPYAWTLVLAEK